MNKIKEIVKELKLNWNEPNYFLVDVNKGKAVITNLKGIIFLAKKKTINIEHETDDEDVIVHDLGNELESLGIYIEHLQLGDEITYQEIEVVKTLNEFLGE